MVLFLKVKSFIFMCGIAGSINYKLDYGKIDQAMHHRGPDEQNGLEIDQVDFFHLRLSILDAIGGKQPMQLQERFFIVFNGEIYNHLELRKQFDLKGNTYSDTETILLLFEKFRENCLKYLDGMFAFAIYDKKEKQLFLTRDRAGEKPLYIYRDATKILFSSELNALKSQLNLQIENNNFYHYLRFGSFYKNLTPYKNVDELTAGTYQIINCDTLETNEYKWWDINDYYQLPKEDCLNMAIEKTNAILQQSVKRRIASSDLEVGCFLSGGIDSGLVTALASQYTNRLKTMTISFNGEYNEAPLAKLVAEKYQTDHTESNINFNNLSNDVEKIICNYGEPFFDSSAIPSYYVSQEAKKNVTVVLTGDGADELFGGYRRYIPFAKYDFFNSHKVISGSASLIKSCLPFSNEKKSGYNHFYRLISFATKSDIDIYLAAGLDIIEGYENNLTSGEYNYLELMRRDFDKVIKSPLSGLEKIMNLDFDIFLCNDVLVKMDIATMNHSLESRSPFLSKEMLEYAPAIKDTFKIKGMTTKFLLREIAKKYLPAPLINQPKRGFEIPLKSWVNNELKEVIHDYVGASSAYHKNFFKQGFTEQLLNNKIKMPAEKRAKLLWTIFSMEVWYKNLYLSV